MEKRGKQPVVPHRKTEYTKDSLKVPPEDSIHDDHIRCCICGEKKKAITSKHLAKHGLTTDEYKQLCGYNPNTHLMSWQRLESSRKVASIAHKSRTGRKNRPRDE